MDATLADSIFDACPILYRHRQSDAFENHLQLGINCGKGWFSVILDTSKQIEQIARNMQAHGMAESELPYVVQLKQKWSVLLFHVENSTAEIDAIIKAAEEQTDKLCERCGEPWPSGSLEQDVRDCRGCGFRLSQTLY